MLMKIEEVLVPVRDHIIIGRNRFERDAVCSAIFLFEIFEHRAQCRGYTLFSFHRFLLRNEVS